MSTIRGVCLCLLMVFVVDGRAFADDWQEWRGPNRNAVSAETNWLSNWPPAVVWSNNIKRGCGPVSVYDGRLYAVGQNTSINEDTVYCFNARTGDVLWTNTYLVSAINSFYGHMAAPTVSGSHVFTFSHDNQLRVWDRMNGAPLADRTFFTSTAGYGACASPLVIGETIIVNAGSFGTAVSKIPPNDIIWGDVSGTNSGYSSPVPLTVDATPYVAIINENSVLSLIPVDGGLSGSPTISQDMHSFGTGAIHGDPIMYGSRIFVCGSQGAAMLNIIGEPEYRLEPQWTKNDQTLCGQYMNSVIVGDYIYGCSFNYKYTDPVGWQGQISCVSAVDGTVRWQRWLVDEGLTEINSRPVVNTVAAGSHIVMMHESGKLNIMKATHTGFDVEGRSWIRPFLVNDVEGEYVAPVVADGLLYCRSAGGELICYQIGPTNSLPDNDGDSLPDTWEQKYFLSRLSCDPAADSDADGHSNEDEFIAGTEPKNRDSALRGNITISNGKVLVSCDSKAADEIEYGNKDRYYTLERKTNLLNGAWEQVTGFIDVKGNDTTIVHTNDAPAPSRFYRIKAKLQ